MTIELRTMLLNEADRQTVLLALARLSVERPGWEDYLHTLALQIDSQRDGRALMFDDFRALRANRVSSQESPPVELRFRVFKRVDATLPGGELGAAVWFCSPNTPETFGVVVGADKAEQFKQGAQFVLVPAPK